MARSKPPVVPNAPKLEISPKTIERGISRLEECVAELVDFDVSNLSRGSCPELKAVEARIESTLIRYFGENTSAYKLYAGAARVSHYPMVFTIGHSTPQAEYTSAVQKNIAESVALLKQAQRALKEDLEDLEIHDPIVKLDQGLNVDSKHLELSRRVFLVHGHDEGARETVARFLEQLGFQCIILHEQANRGGTIIEKIERNSDVGFAVVLLTPDDDGCAAGGTPEPRARQNVLLELGYFIGRLGREKVCALKRGTVEIPSDFAGVVWESMDNSGWKQALGRELEAAGHDIDWNKVMRA